jgi:hypothetical protein
MKRRRIRGGGLPVHIKLGGPPRLQTVFELNVGSDKNVTALGIADSIEGFNVQISRLFHVLRVGYEIRTFLGVSSIRTQTEQFYKSN